MPARQVLTRVGQVARVLSSGSHFITSVSMPGSPDLREFTLTPQGRTNPGTKDQPLIFFGLVKNLAEFNQFRKSWYVSARYILVPKDRGSGETIYYRHYGLGGDYVKTDALDPATDQWVVEIGPDFEKEEVPVETAKPPTTTSWLAFWKIL